MSVLRESFNASKLALKFKVHRINLLLDTNYFFNIFSASLNVLVV